MNSDALKNKPANKFLDALEPHGILLAAGLGAILGIFLFWGSWNR